MHGTFWEMMIAFTRHLRHEASLPKAEFLLMMHSLRMYIAPLVWQVSHSPASALVYNHGARAIRPIDMPAIL